MSSYDKRGDEMLEIGDRFGKWTVTDTYHVDKWHKKLWTVTCDCGMINFKREWDLRNGASKGCNYCKTSKKWAKDLSGEKFGWWSVLKRVENSWDNRAMFLCRCECGAEYEVKGSALTAGQSTKCRHCQPLWRKAS